MFDWFEAVIGPFHAAFGFIGLAAFWVPIVSKKGGTRHVTFGKIFLYSAYVVLGSAGISVVYRLSRSLLAGVGPAQEPVLFSFLLFLGYLALVTFVIVHHAIGVLRTKDNPDALATGFNIFLGRLAILASVALIVYTMIVQPPVMILLYALSPIGFSAGWGIHKYLSGNRPSNRQWLYEHLGGMLGAGIAFHTAFAVFGVAQIWDFRLEGWVAVIPWLTPAALGIPATIVWTRHYQRKFGEIGVTA